MSFLLSQIIDQSAERFPEREAFRFYKGALTYSELVKCANSLAKTLQEQGVESRDRVGIYMNKCIETPIAMYGIMKAGAAYVPLDPSAPSARLTYLIRDCGISHLISQESKKKALAQIVSTGTDLQCVIGLRPREELPMRCVPWDEVFEVPGET